MKVARNVYRSVAGTAVLALALPAQADHLVTGGRIVRVVTTRTANDPSFVVLTEGGTGPCAIHWIYFYPSGASNPEIQKRSYAAALMAMSTGMRVDIDAIDANCQGAYVISVYP